MVSFSHEFRVGIQYGKGLYELTHDGEGQGYFEQFDTDDVRNDETRDKDTGQTHVHELLGRELILTVRTVVAGGVGRRRF